MAKLLIALFVFGCIAGAQTRGFALESSTQEQTGGFPLRLQTPSLLQGGTSERFISNFGFASAFEASAEGIVPTAELEKGDALSSWEGGPKYTLASRLVIGAVSAFGTALVVGGMTAGAVLLFNEPLMAIISIVNGYFYLLVGVPAAVQFVGDLLGGVGEYLPALGLWVLAQVIMIFGVLPGVSALMSAGGFGVAVAVPLGVSAFAAMFVAPAWGYEAWSARNRKRNRIRLPRSVGLSPVFAPDRAGTSMRVEGATLAIRGTF